MNTVGFASTFSLADLLEELPLPKALNIRNPDQLTNEVLNFQDVQELQNISSIISPAIQMARMPSNIDRLRFKDPSLAPTPNMRTHHAEASPLMSVVIGHYQQFQDIMTVPPYNPPTYEATPPPAHPPNPPTYEAPPHSAPTYETPARNPQIYEVPPPRHIPTYEAAPRIIPPHEAVPHIAQIPDNPPRIQPNHEISPRIPPPVHVAAPRSLPVQASLPRNAPIHEASPYNKSTHNATPYSTPSNIAHPKKSHTSVRKGPSPEKRKKKPEIELKGASYEDLEKFLLDLTDDLTSSQLARLVAITSRLKKKNHTHYVNTEKLKTLMILLSNQIQQQTEQLKNSSYDDEENIDEDSERIRLQKFETCRDCAVTALNVMTSSNMDSRIYLEECVEAIINFVNVGLAIIQDTVTSPKKTTKHSDKKSSKRALFSKNNLSRLSASCSEVLALVNELLVCKVDSTLNDSLLLSTSRAATSAFFLMDVTTTSNELQLNALNVITAIFASYKNHQTVILEELIHSIARLPTTKRNRVPYQVSSTNNESISIFSALIMKLIQSLFTIKRHHQNGEKSSSQANTSQADVNDANEYERILRSQYNSALRASYAFVSSFLRRCCGVDKKDDNDYRVLFETFVEDLMICLHKPDWSSAQLITHVLVKLLISNINPQPGRKNQQSTNQTLKLASLEHLGTICARLVKEKSTLPIYKREVKKALKTIDLSSLYLVHGGDFKSKRLRSKSMKKDGLSDSETEDEGEGSARDVDCDVEEPEILSKLDEKKFWLALLTYCQREKGISKCGRNIFCAIWLKEIERRAKSQHEAANPSSVDDATSVSDEEESNGAQSFSSQRKQYSRNNNEEAQPQINGQSAEDIQADMAREFFKLLMISAKRSAKAKNLTIEGTEGSQSTSIAPDHADEDSTIDETTASNIIKLLDISLQTTQKLIDASLSHIVAALSSTANTNIRSRAMKSLSHVLNDAPKECAARLLTRDDLQKAIGASLLDQSTSVRESTVELIGRFILNSQSEALIDKYYDMLTNRIMDSGVSVRKRVIKILREICITYPHYPRVPEICSIIIKRINDEGEGIRKLVSETFTQMWFKEERSSEAIVAKVACITHVVATVWSKILAETNVSTGAESHFEWLHQLLSSLLKVKTNSDDQTNNISRRKPKTSESEQNEDGEVVAPEVVNVKQTLAASTQIISVLMSEKLTNGSQESTTRADCLAAVTALWSFAKVCPMLLAHYLDVIQPFINVDKRLTLIDLLILEKVIQIIELISPSISNPRESTLNVIETNLGKLIIQGSISVIPASVSCLSELIHRHTHNEQLANDMFKRFLRLIRQYRTNPSTFETPMIPHILRALYTCGLLAKHFNVEDCDILYADLIHFVEVGIRQNQYQNGQLSSADHIQDRRILLKSLEGLGFMFERSPSHMLKDSTARIYRYFMGRAIDLGPNDSSAASICVITNLRNYLQDEVTQEIKSASAIDWSRENLKEMTSSKQEDANSIQSSVIQLYLRDMLSCALSSSREIRQAAIKLIHGVHNGGHINPLSIVPSLIALSSDDDFTIRVRADHILQEIERKYSNFVNMKSKQGVLESFILNRGKRGFHRLDTEKQRNSVYQNDMQTEQVQESTSSSQSINIVAKLSNLYSVIATNRQQRRAFINSLLRYFDIQTLASAPNMLSSDQNESRFVLSKCIHSDILMFVCDNLMFLPFNLLDEPFFLIHQIGITMSNLVSQAVSQFREILQLSSADDDDVDDEEEIEINDNELSEDSTGEEVTDEEEEPEMRRHRKLIEKQNRLRQRKLDSRQRKIQQRGLEQNLMNALEAQDNNNEIDDLPVSILQVKDLVSSLHRCILLMHCKRVIWDLYGVTEQKFEDYTPNESSKITDKPTHRKNFDEQTYDSLTKMPQTTVHFESGPFLRAMYSDIFGFEEDQAMMSHLEQITPDRHKLKLEYKRFSQLMTK